MVNPQKLYCGYEISRTNSALSVLPLSPEHLWRFSPVQSFINANLCLVFIKDCDKKLEGIGIHGFRGPWHRSSSKGPWGTLSENAKVMLTVDVARPRCLREMMVQCFSRTASLGWCQLSCSCHLKLLSSGSHLLCTSRNQSVSGAVL